MNKYTLSICIPTYNRADAVTALIRRILSCPDADLEVVVLDNASLDDTVQRLAAIDDPRLAVHRNPVNRGVLFNVLNVLLKARGARCVLVLDKDDADPRALPAFKAFLARERPTFGYCEYHSSSATTAEIHAQGVDALRQVAYSCHHPTGYFFETARLHQLDIGRQFADADYVGHFCFEFIFAELAMLGRGAVYHPPTFAPETLVAAAQKKSFGTNASQEDAFFSPKGRLKMAVNFSRQIAALPIPPRDRRQLIVARFVHGMMQATSGFKAVLASQELCSHYHISARAVPARELMHIALQFYRGFVEVMVTRGAGAVRISRAALLWALFARGSRELAQRIARRA